MAMFFLFMIGFLFETTSKQRPFSHRSVEQKPNAFHRCGDVWRADRYTAHRTLRVPGHDWILSPLVLHAGQPGYPDRGSARQI